MAGPDPRKQREEALPWLKRVARDLAAAALVLRAAEPLQHGGPRVVEGVP